MLNALGTLLLSQWQSWSSSWPELYWYHCEHALYLKNDCWGQRLICFCQYTSNPRSICRWDRLALNPVTWSLQRLQPYKWNAFGFDRSFSFLKRNIFVIAKTMETRDSVRQKKWRKHDQTDKSGKNWKNWLRPSKQVVSGKARAIEIGAQWDSDWPLTMSSMTD